MIFVRTKNKIQSEAAKTAIKEAGADKECLVSCSENDGKSGCVFVESYEELSKFIPRDTNKSAGGEASTCNIILQSSIHIWNISAVESIQNLGLQTFGFIASYELTEHELMDLYRVLPESVIMILPIYGRIPLMYTKNCIKLTNGLCNKTSEFVKINDRKNVDFPIYSDCEKCRNIIYNSVPLSLHNHIKINEKFKDVILDFTDEDENTVEKIMKYYLESTKEFPLKNYTTGHFKKAVL